MEPATSPPSLSHSKRCDRGNVGLGVSCSTTANQHLPNRRKRLNIEESGRCCSCSEILGVTVGAGGGESVGHSGVDKDGRRGCMHIVSEVQFSRAPSSRASSRSRSFTSCNTCRTSNKQQNLRIVRSCDRTNYSTRAHCLLPMSWCLAHMPFNSTEKNATSR
jgi:hypothetical protein